MVSAAVMHLHRVSCPSEGDKSLRETRTPQVPGLVHGWVQLAGLWPAPSGGINYSEGPTYLEVQEQGQLL